MVTPWHGPRVSSCGKREEVGRPGCAGKESVGRDLASSG